MFSQPHCKVELLGALIRFTVSSPVYKHTKVGRVSGLSLLPHLLFIGSKERVVVQVSRSDDVLTGVFRYEGSVRGSVQRSLTIQTDSKAELRT